MNEYDVREPRCIYDDQRGTTITAYLVNDDGTPNVGVVAVVKHCGVEIGRADVWDVEHGTLDDGTEADAFDWTPAMELPGNVVVMGSPLWSVTAEAVAIASGWVRNLAGRDGHWLSRDRTALGGLEQFVAPRNDALMDETHGLALAENEARERQAATDDDEWTCPDCGSTWDTDAPLPDDDGQVRCDLCKAEDVVRS